MQGRSLWILVTAVAAAITAALVLHVIERSRTLRTSLASSWFWLDHDQDDHSVDITTYENSAHETKFVLISHLAMTDDERATEKLNSRREQINSNSTFIELGNLEVTRSSFKGVVCDVPNPEASGVWIDGRKLPNDGDLVVAYTSETRPATIVAIPAGEREAFFYELWHSKSPFAWLDRWIVPRLPEIEEQQTTTMVNR
jgi:hypothetical protein